LQKVLDQEEEEAQKALETAMEQQRRFAHFRTWLAPDLTSSCCRYFADIDSVRLPEEPAGLAAAQAFAAVPSVAPSPVRPSEPASHAGSERAKRVRPAASGPAAAAAAASPGAGRTPSKRRYSDRVQRAYHSYAESKPRAEKER
jgi:hypothetical protein